MRRIVLACAAALAMAGCAKENQAEEAPAVAETAAPALTPEQQALATDVQAATDRYEDVKVAEAEGYMKDPSGMCVMATEMGLPAEAGGMGIHWFRPDLLGITAQAPRVDGGDAVIDPAAPEVLVYEPQTDGSMALVAAEYLVFQQAWTAAGNAAPPALAGQTFFSMADDPATPMDEAHGFAPHHELHVWVHRDNPTGLFSEFNPSVSCAHAGMAGM